jgi:hypothetical protein
MSVVWGMLAKLLPVLNGMVYSDGAVREYVWRHGHGVAVLLHMVTRALPLELRVVTVFTLANLTQRYTTLPLFGSSAGFYRSSPFCFDFSLLLNSLLLKFSFVEFSFVVLLCRSPFQTHVIFVGAATTTRCKRTRPDWMPWVCWRR